MSAFLAAASLFPTLTWYDWSREFKSSIENHDCRGKARLSMFPNLSRIIYFAVNSAVCIFQKLLVDTFEITALQLKFRSVNH